ncbi:MAG: DNA-binding protein [Chloroflexi bacterium]|nr:DNA-binding protein [Chloroflexota bacterium]|tara:strand:- start:78729 stop:79136 length:408 start_codon:yes stop_codon:yes gene_type:complete
MLESNIKESKRWKDQSDYDFQLANKLLASDYSISCFLFQQAAEKSIVSYLILRGTDKVWGSSISDLAEDCLAIDPTFDFLKSYGPILDKYLYSTRYPTFSISGSPFEIFNISDAEKAKELSNEVIKFCEEKIKDL